MTVPPFVEEMGVSFAPTVEDAIRDVDVIMMLRIQMERQGRNLFPSIREYARCFGLNRDRLKHAREDVLIMHPGPVNRGVEISPDVLDTPFTVILDQVTNGVAIRMALMYLLIGR